MTNSENPKKFVGIRDIFPAKPMRVQLFDGCSPCLMECGCNRSYDKDTYWYQCVGDRNRDTCSFCPFESGEKVLLKRIPKETLDKANVLY